jgi:SAM-dependent methyltransferase
MSFDSRSNQYWEDRKDAIYFYVAREICRKYAPRADSCLDVGSNNTPALEWYRFTSSRLVSVDLRSPYVAEGVESIKINFFDFEPDSKFDLVTCFQVLEHVTEPRAFAQKLLSVARTLVVSVPYKWAAGKCKWHVQDPVDEAKMRDWFGREPKFNYIARELSNVQRLIQVYRNE